jgi:hypothetical protein
MAGAETTTPRSAVGRMADRRLPSRLVGRRASNLVGTIEGAIVATALVAGLDEADTVSPARALWLLLATATFFWLAHAYADLLAGRIQGHYRMNREDIVRVVARERPLCQAALPLAVPLVLGAVGVLSDGQALNLAWLVGVAALVGWGVLFARREGYGYAGVVGTASVNACVGLLIIVLKVAVG